MAALGDSFEFVSGECGRTKATAGTWAAECFWFAKVRPKKAGRFAVGYTITFDFELTPLYRANWRWSDSATYILPLAIGEKGRPRLMATNPPTPPRPIHSPPLATRSSFPSMSIASGLATPSSPPGPRNPMSCGTLTQCGGRAHAQAVHGIEGRRARGAKRCGGVRESALDLG